MYITEDEKKPNPDRDFKHLRSEFHYGRILTKESHNVFQFGVTNDIDSSWVALRTRSSSYDKEKLPDTALFSCTQVKAAYVLWSYFATSVLVHNCESFLKREALEIKTRP